MGIRAYGHTKYGHTAMWVSLMIFDSLILVDYHYIDMYTSPMRQIVKHVVSTTSFII